MIFNLVFWNFLPVKMGGGVGEQVFSYMSEMSTEIWESFA